MQRFFIQDTKFGFVKICAFWNTLLRKCKIISEMGKIRTNHISDKGFLFKIYKGLGHLDGSHSLSPPAHHPQHPPARRRTTRFHYDLADGAFLTGNSSGLWLGLRGFWLIKYSHWFHFPNIKHLNYNTCSSSLALLTFKTHRGFRFINRTWSSHRWIIPPPSTDLVFVFSLWGGKLAPLQFWDLTTATQ